jgi:hypothetical protein
MFPSRVGQTPPWVRSGLLRRRRRRGLRSIAFTAFSNRIKRLGLRRRLHGMRKSTKLISGLPVEGVLAYLDDTIHSAQGRRNRRLDRLGDLFFLASCPAALATSVPLLRSGAPAFTLLLPFFILMFSTMIAILCWFSVNALINYEQAARRVITQLGGIGSFPAALWSSDWYFARSRQPVFDDLLEEFRTSTGLDNEQRQVFDQLLRDRYEGSLDELVNASQVLARR